MKQDPHKYHKYYLATIYHDITRNQRFLLFVCFCFYSSVHCFQIMLFDYVKASSGAIYTLLLHCFQIAPKALKAFAYMMVMLILLTSL